MKGISAVIATILMLMITIALAGTAYLYITGVFTSRTGVVLSIDGQSSTCKSNAGDITVYVKNDGTSVAGSVAIDLTYPNASTFTCTNTISSINAGGSGSTTCSRDPSATSGLYGLRVYGGGSSATGSIYCAS
jgi:flagellin-like protein